MWKRNIKQEILTRIHWWAAMIDPSPVIMCTSAPCPSLKSFSHTSFVAVGTRQYLGSALFAFFMGNGGGFGISLWCLYVEGILSSRKSEVSDEFPSSICMLKDRSKDSMIEDGQEMSAPGEPIKFYRFLITSSEIPALSNFINNWRMQRRATSTKSKYKRLPTLH